jgi:hypothetical protein
MRYPKVVQDRIDILNKYTESDTIQEFDILHLYSGDLAHKGNWGYIEARRFVLIGYDTSTLQKRNLGTHDAIYFDETIPIYIVMVYADGAFLIKFDCKITGNFTSQAVFIKKAA